MTRCNRISLKRFSLAPLSAALLASTLAITPAQAQERDEFSVCWSIYAGWMPWAYADVEGIVDKWADEYGISIDVVQVNDYVESINQFTSGNVDGCAMTNMDALTIPAASGVDSTALIINDYSDGNDGIVLKGSDDLADVALMKSPELLETMERVAEFSFEHGLLGDMAPNAGVVGIETPSGVFGDESNVQLRFDPSFTQAYLDAQ